MNKGKHKSDTRRVWKRCENCAAFQPAKREGVCGYLTEYNQQTVYIPTTFKCVKWQAIEETKR